MKKILFVAAAMMVGAQSAMAINYMGQINTSGSQSGNTYYVQLANNSPNCTYGNVYFEGVSAAGKGQLAVALVALTSGKNVYIDFKQDSTGLCSGINFMHVIK